MSSGDEHQIDTEADDQELQRKREVESELALMGNLAISDPTGGSFTNEKDPSLLTPELVQSLYTEDVAIQIQTTRKICKLVSDSPNPLYDEIIKSGTVPRFVHFLEDTGYPELQFESASVLNQIVSGNSAQTQAVIDAGAVPIFIKLLSSSDETVVEKSACALGNIARDSEESLDFVLNSNVLPPLLGLFNNGNLSTPMMRKLTWTLACLCCGNSPPIFEQVSKCLPLLCRLMVKEDDEILTEACGALSGLSDGPNEQIQVVIDSGVCPRAVQLLSHTSTKVVKAVLGLVGNITSGDDLQTQTIVNANALPALRSLLFHEDESIVMEACQTLSNITAGNEQQIQAVMDANILPSLIMLLHHRNLEIGKEAAWAIANAASTGSDQQIVYIVEAGAIAPLCKLLSQTDSDLIEIILSCLSNILRTGESFTRQTGSTVNPFATLICNSPSMYLALYSENTAMQLDATKRFGKLLGTREGLNLIFDEVIKMAGVPRFVHFLEDTRYPELQFESASVLNKIVNGNSAQTQVVIDAGAVPIFIRLLSSSDAKVVEKSVWALGNIACDSTESRLLVLNSNVLPPFLGLFNNDNASLSLLRSATTILRNLCDKKPPLNFEQVSQCLPHLARLMVNVDDAEVLFGVCLTLTCLCEGSNEQIQAVIESGVCPRAIQLLSHSSTNVVKGAILLLRIITSRDDSQIQVLINENALPAIGSLLSHENESIVRNACWALCNMTSEKGQQIQAVIDANILPSLIELLHHGSVEIRQLAGKATFNAISSGSDEQIVYIVEAGAIPPLCKVFSEVNPLYTAILLHKIRCTGESMAKAAGSTENPYATLVKQCAGPEEITILSFFLTKDQGDGIDHYPDAF